MLQSTNLIPFRTVQKYQHSLQIKIDLWLVLTSCSSLCRYRCIVPYPPQTEHELELELGDIVHVHKRREDGWYKGTQERTCKTGLFPGSFVEKCD